MERTDASDLTASLTPLAGVRIIYLEDEALVAINCVDTLEDLGCTVDAYATLHEASAALTKGAYDVALLDVNIHGRMSYDIAQAALDRGIPVAFLTGYARDGLQPDWRHYPYCEKPCTLDDLQALIATALKPVTPAPAVAPASQTSR